MAVQRRAHEIVVSDVVRWKVPTLDIVVTVELADLDTIVERHVE